ncbi:MAG: hypothetical protein KAJ19_09320 [Gammaproteobacteria bacterium]|nr:hypothetical protein [Gammaproteobacteria bacterium]
MSEEKLAVVDDKETAVDQHSEIRAKVKDLRNKVDEDYWKLSEVISEVYEGSYYVGWGFKSYREYIEQELDFQWRKAQYLVSIQGWFGQMKPNVQKWVRSLGWTKAKELVGVVTQDNAAQWKKKIEGKSYRDLQDIIKAAKEKAEASTGEASADGSEPAAPDRAVRKNFGLFSGQLDNVERALTKAKEVGNTDKDGHALDMICVDYLATNGEIGTLTDYLKRIEKHLGVQLVAFDRKEDAVVYGGDLLDEIAGPEDDEKDEKEAS